MDQDLTQEDWQQIALYYQKKYGELELQALRFELALQKEQAKAAAAAESEDPKA